MRTVTETVTRNGVTVTVVAESIVVAPFETNYKVLVDGVRVGWARKHRYDNIWYYAQEGGSSRSSSFDLLRSIMVEAGVKAIESSTGKGA